MRNCILRIINSQELEFYLCVIGCKAMLCYFHREKAWNEWINKGAHNVKNQDDLKYILRLIAESETERKYEIALIF